MKAQLAVPSGEIKTVKLGHNRNLETIARNASKLELNTLNLI